jgi:hypothetical protein
LSKVGKIRVVEPCTKKRRPIPESIRRQVFERDDYTCRYCYAPADQIDHIMPVSYLRDDSLENLVACCRLCNLLCSNKIFNSFNRKRAYLIEWYDKNLPKAERLVWCIKDVMELRGRLRQYIIDTCIIVDTPQIAEKIIEGFKKQRIKIVLGRDDLLVW